MFLTSQRLTRVFLESIGEAGVYQKGLVLMTVSVSVGRDLRRAGIKEACRLVRHVKCEVVNATRGSESQ